MSFKLLLQSRSTKPTRSLLQGKATYQGRTRRSDCGHRSGLLAQTHEASLEGACVWTLKLRTAVPVLKPLPLCRWSGTADCGCPRALLVYVLPLQADLPQLPMDRLVTFNIEPRTCTDGFPVHCRFQNGPDMDFLMSTNELEALSEEIETALDEEGRRRKRRRYRRNLLERRRAENDAPSWLQGGLE